MDVIFFGAMLAVSIIFYYFGSWFENKTLVFAGYVVLFLLGLFVFEGLDYQQLQSQNSTIITNYSYSTQNMTHYDVDHPSGATLGWTLVDRMDNSTQTKDLLLRYTAVEATDYFRWTFGLLLSLIGIYGILTLALFKREQTWV